MRLNSRGWVTGNHLSRVPVTVDMGKLKWQGTQSPLFSKLFSKSLVNANFKPQLIRIVQGILNQFGVFSSHWHYRLGLILVSGYVSKGNALGQGPHVNFGSHKHPLIHAVSIGASLSCIHVTLSSASEYGIILLLLCSTESPRISFVGGP